MPEIVYVSMEKNLEVCLSHRKKCLRFELESLHQDVISHYDLVEGGLHGQLDIRLKIIYPSPIFVKFSTSEGKIGLP